MNRQAFGRGAATLRRGSRLQSSPSTPAMSGRHGKVLVCIAIMLVPLMGFGGLAVDSAFLRQLHKELQNTADVCAHVGAHYLPNENSVRENALPYAEKNMAAELHGTVLINEDIVVGNWDFDSRTFSPYDPLNPEPINAVQVTTRRTVSNGNPAPLFFANIFGLSRWDVAAVAVGVKTAVASGIGTRFLIDEDMIDTDVRAIQDLAKKLNKKEEDLITDKDGDWFIDLPPGETLELPTGQLQDEALFDIAHPEFPFTMDSDPSFTDFLNYNEDSSSWRYNLIPKEMLDPLLGVSVVNDQNLWPSFVDPNFVHVSPVFKGDISKLNDVKGPNGNIPAVNALGWRRGLLAFKIIGVGQDPDGNGSKLPNLIIQVVDPKNIDINQVVPPSSVGASKVRLVW